MVDDTVRMMRGMSYKPQNQGDAKVGSILEVELRGGDTNQKAASQISIL